MQINVGLNSDCTNNYTGKSRSDSPIDPECRGYILPIIDTLGVPTPPLRAFLTPVTCPRATYAYGSIPFFLTSLPARYNVCSQHPYFLKETWTQRTFPLNSCPILNSFRFFDLLVASSTAISAISTSSSLISSCSRFFVSLSNLTLPFGPRVNPSTDVRLSLYKLPLPCSGLDFERGISESESSSSIITRPVSESILNLDASWPGLRRLLSQLSEIVGHRVRVLTGQSMSPNTLEQIHRVVAICTQPSRTIQFLQRTL